MKKVIWTVTGVVVLLVISVALGFVWLLERSEQIKESNKNGFLQKYGSCVEQIEADYPQLEFVSANYNGVESVSFYYSEEISEFEHINMSYEIFDIIREKSYEIYGSDTDEAVCAKIASKSYNYFKIDNVDLNLKISTNCEISEKEIKEIITEDFKVIKESEQ